MLERQRIDKFNSKFILKPKSSVNRQIRNRKIRIFHKYPYVPIRYSNRRRAALKVLMNLRSALQPKIN